MSAFGSDQKPGNAFRASVLNPPPYIPALLVIYITV